MSQSGLRGVLQSERANAALAWALVVFLVGTAAGELVTGDGLWAGFVLAVAALAALPAVALRSARAMLPWEVLALASLPAVGRALVAGETVAGFLLTGRLATWLAVATVALIVAVEVDVFTPVRMNHQFAVVFVTITTMAAAGIWAVVRWLADRYLGTAFLLKDAPEAVHTTLMWDFVAATGVGVLAGVVFEYYFRRRAAALGRLPPAVRPEEEP